MVSIVIPARNERFLNETLEDILKKAEGKIEILVNLDENPPDKYINDPRVLYHSEHLGMRRGINKCVENAKGEYIMKTDAHCLFGQGFDKILVDNHQKYNWIQVPRRYALDPVNWKIEERTDDKYPIDYMYTDFPRKGKRNDDGTHGVPWKERREERKDPKYDIDETPCFQGSCYFMTRNYFLTGLEGLHEEGYGEYAQETQEICFKTWLTGGSVMVNKKTFYAHLHKGQTYGRMYHLPGGVVEADAWSASHWLNNEEPGMAHRFEWLIDVKFPNMPGWPKDWKEQIKEMGWIK